MASLQELLNHSHKERDNWTRDRGCAIHGRDACEASCVYHNRAPVPKGYKLMRAEKNRNPPMLQTYLTSRNAMKEECGVAIQGKDFVPMMPHSSEVPIAGEDALDPDVN